MLPGDFMDSAADSLAHLEQLAERITVALESGPKERELIDAVLARDSALASMGGLASLPEGDIGRGLDPTYVRLARAIAAVRRSSPEKA